MKIGDLVKYMSRTVLVVGYADHNGQTCDEKRFKDSEGFGWIVGCEIDTMVRRLYDSQECEVISEGSK